MRLFRGTLIYFCLFMCILCVFDSYCMLLYYCEHGGLDLMGLKPNPNDLSSFSAWMLLVGSFDL